VTTSAPKAGGTATHGPKAGSTSTGSGKSTGAGQASTKKPESTTASTSHGKSGKGTGGSSTSDDTSTTTPPDTTAAADAPEPNDVSIKIGKNSAQLAKIQPQLDALGLTLEEATKGFRNQGQFIAALNAAKNHNLDFVALQEAMTVDGMSLGQAAKKVANTPPPAETPEGDAGTGGTGTGSTGTGTTGTGSTGTGSTGTGSTGTGTGTAQ
jgi:hypothetical protein